MTRRPSERHRYRRTNWLLFSLGAIYVFIALERERIPGREEVFPFAAWSLYSKVPNECQDYSLRVIAVRGHTLAQPVFFEDSTNLFPTAAQNDGARMCIQRLGSAMDRHDDNAADKERREFEFIHLGGAGNVVYELVHRRYDPIQRMNTRTFLEVRSLATFQTQPRGTSPTAGAR
ncbi:MAG TPA: hypothetical protein VF669_00870 [Tepidisphaeraceae bacterium]|jgi:hypothetical protein